MAGALPPPGTYFLNYLSHYSADRLNDGQGKALLPGFDLDVTANTLRLVHVTDRQILGASWAVHAFVPLVYLDVDIQPAPGLTLGDGRFGVGDIIIDPFILGWHWPNFHLIAALDIYLPTGHFDASDLANPGRNYWTLEPVVAFTYLSDGGLEASAKLMYDFNSKNDDTGYHSGQEFHVDYTLALHRKEWTFGLGGSYYRQMTSDKLFGAKVGPDGFKGRALAVGPQVKYDHRNMSFTLKYQIESGVENRPEGDTLWLKFLYVL